MKRAFSNRVMILFAGFVLSACDNIVSQFVNLGIGTRMPSSDISVDSKPPTLTGILDDGVNFVSITTSSTLTWPAATDSETGVGYYEVAIGTSAGATDVKTWTSVYNVTSTQITGLSLTSGTTYYASVRAVDLSGNKSTALQSDGWVAIAAPSTIVSIDDDIAYNSTTDTPTITWNYPGTLVAGPLNFHFEIAIGTTAGASNTVTWESVGVLETWSKTGLSLSAGTRYFATVRIVDNIGTVYSTINGDGWYAVSSVTSAARYSIAQNWNEYADRGTPTNTCADGSNYFSCIHGGESRRVNYVAAASCTNYTIADELGAFDWACDATGGAGNVFFYTIRLKETKNLSDLLNSTSWKNNRVVISLSGTPVAASTRGAWWTNTIANLTNFASTTPTPNVIYTVTSNLTIDSSVVWDLYTTGPFALKKGIGFVVFPGYEIQYTNGSYSVGPFQYGQYIWIEGSFRSVQGGGHLMGTGVVQSMIRNVSLSGFESSVYNGFSYNYVHNMRMSYMSSGFYMESAHNNVFYKFRVDNTSGDALLITDSENNNLFIEVFLANAGNRGLYHYTTTNNYFIGMTIVNANGDGFSTTGNTGGVYKNMVILNSGAGITTNSDTRLTFDNVITPRVYLFNENNDKFSHNLILNNSSVWCDVIAGTIPGLVHNTCANAGSSNASLQQVSGFGASSFVGEVSTEDTANTSDVLGVQAFASILDWTKFDNWFRSWAPLGTFNTTATQGQCMMGNCQIYDFGLKSADTQLKGYAISVGGVMPTTTTFTNGAACPDQLNGNIVTVTAAASPITYLTHAREILGMGGNNNGFCESNETCLYMPNFGFYQGSGNFWNNTCTFTNGTVTGVKMYAYPVN